MNYIRYLIAKNIRLAFAYRLEFIGMLLVLAVSYGFRVTYLNRLFAFTDNVGGWSRVELIFIAYTLIVVSLITDAFDTSIHAFFRKVYQGESEPYFIRPVHIFHYLFLGWMKVSSLVIGGVLGALSPLFFPEIWANAEPFRIICYIALVFVGVAVNLLLITILSSLTFVFKRRVPSDFIFGEMTRIMVLPESLYGKNVGRGLLLMVPSIFCSAIPSAVLVQGKYDLGIWMLAGLGVTALLFKLIYQATFRHYEGLGG